MYRVLRNGKYHTTEISYRAQLSLGNLPDSHAEAMVALFHALGDVEYPLEHPTVYPIFCVQGRLFRQKFPCQCVLLNYRNVFMALREDERRRLVLSDVRKRGPYTYNEDELLQILEEMTVYA